MVLEGGMVLREGGMLRRVFRCRGKNIEQRDVSREGRNNGRFRKDRRKVEIMDIRREEGGWKVNKGNKVGIKKGSKERKKRMQRENGVQGRVNMGQKKKNIELLNIISTPLPFP